MIDDAAITANVKTEISDEPSLKAAQIRVENFKGTVQPSDTVAGPSSMSKASEVTRRVQGVKLINNDLRVR